MKAPVIGLFIKASIVRNYYLSYNSLVAFTLFINKIKFTNIMNIPNMLFKIVNVFVKLTLPTPLGF